MAWYCDAFPSTSAGVLLTVLDATLPDNTNWSIYDGSAGTNAKVYRCTDGVNIDWYVKVDDNYTAYAIVELWQGWNSGSHSGTGTSRIYSSSTNTLHIPRPAGNWYIKLYDTGFIFVDNNGCCTFIGAPTLFDTSLNVCMMIGAPIGTTNTYNYLAYYAANMYPFLFDESGSNTTTAAQTGPGDATSADYKAIKGCDGKFYFEPRMYISGGTSSPRKILGYIEGVCNLGTVIYGYVPTHGEIFSVDGSNWITFGGSSGTKYWSAIRMD